MSGLFSLPLIDPVAGPREYLAGQENALVRVARRVVLASDRRHLPLVICGPVGAGKTFLAEGLAEAWREQMMAGGDDCPTVLRITGVDFARQYANACVTDSLADFRESLVKAGLILLDAADKLAEKPRAARELCIQLDAWLTGGKVVIVTSIAPPGDLPNSGLASRLSAGLVVPLALPSSDTRRQMLAALARERSLSLADDLLDRLAERLTGAVSNTPSPRDLHSALVKLESTARLTGSAIDASLVESLLRPAKSMPLDARRVLAAVARRFGVSVDELRSSSRRRSLVQARGVAILLARRLTDDSLQSLGELLGRRDHSTIHHALQTTEQAVAGDTMLKDLVDELQTELANHRVASNRAKAGEPKAGKGKGRNKRSGG